MTKEEVLLANLFLNLKGSKEKRDDWISIAEKCKKIVKESKNRNEAAQKLGVSSELVRSIINLLKLPDEVKQLVKERKILFDAAQRINTIKLKDKRKEEIKRIEVAKTIAGLTSHEQREIIQYAKKFPNSGLTNYKKRVVATREVRNVHVIVVTLEDSTYNFLQKYAKKEKITIEKLVQKLIDEKIKRVTK